MKDKANYCLNCKTKPCTNGCPLGNNIPEFIKRIREDDYEGAFNVLEKTTILMPICGRICPHKKQCEGSCVRGIKGEPVSIGELEAFVGDMALENNFKLNVPELNGKKVAIIGGGPSGITAAYSLRKNGFDVTIYEKYNYLGGLLYHGIPEFRLNKDLLKKWIEKILSVGINVKYNMELGKNVTLEELKEEFDAILLSFGANISSKMNIPGEDLKGVFGGNELLEYNKHPNYEGKRVAVIGGGNVAMDTARTVNKMHAKEVTVIYRRSKKEMPAEEKEIEESINEGIKFLFQTNIKQILSDTDEVKQIECIKTNLVKKEDSDRLVPVNIEGSEFLLDIDYCIFAIGSNPEIELINTINLEKTKWGYIIVDENYETSEKNVFASGDIIGEKQTVAWAAKCGREAAKKIIQKLK